MAGLRTHQRCHSHLYLLLLAMLMALVLLLLSATQRRSPCWWRGQAS